MLERDDNFTLQQIAAYAGCEKAFAKAVEPQIGKLPKTAGIAVDGVLKTGPRQYWLFGKRADVPADLGAATDLSQSRARLILDGPDAWKRLMAASPVDFDPAEFKVNAFAMTGIHHTPVLIWRTGETRYEIFALRTFAQDVAEWLAG
jgi:methylglutamate dehydrogenase subunit D